MTLYSQIKEYLMGKYDFRYNVITNNVEISVKKKDKFTPMKEANIIEELFEEGWTAFALQFKVMVASESVAPPYNPIDNYFDNLPKYHVNGKKDYIKELLSFITLADESKRAFFEEQFTKWIARAVACARGSLKVNKQCFTLIGKQNDGKTSFFRYLVPKTLAEFYAENVNVQKNDGEFMLTQSFLINWDEMAQFSKYEVSAIKTFMTKENVRQRRPYATKAEMFRRICSFVASTNEEEILSDHTGNSRFLCFKIDAIKHDNGGKNGYCAIDMDNVYAQVIHLLNDKNFNMQMNNADMKILESENLNYKKITNEGELIARHLVPHNFPTDKEYPILHLQATRLLSRLFLTYPEYKTLSSVVLGKELSAQKFEKIQKKNEVGVNTWYWAGKLIKPFRELTIDGQDEDLATDEPQTEPDDSLPF